MQENIKFIVNPVAGNHRAGKEWPKFEKQLKSKLKNISVEFTSHKNHAKEITRHALQDGCSCVVAVGGDGTLNEIVNGFIDDGKIINKEAKLGLIPFGTGSDFARTVGLSDTFEKALSVIHSRKTQLCDLGTMTYQDHKGEKSTHYFINVADTGFGGAVAHTVNNASKFMGPHFTYFLGLLRTMGKYKNKSVRLRIDDTVDAQATINSIVIANGRYFGGGMHVAPDASINDGLFDIIVIGDITKIEAVTNIRALYNGTLCNHIKVNHYQGRRISIDSEQPVLIEADGETPGLLPATFEIIPGALQFIC